MRRLFRLFLDHIGHIAAHRHPHRQRVLAGLLDGGVQFLLCRRQFLYETDSQHFGLVEVVDGVQFDGDSGEKHCTASDQVYREQSVANVDQSNASRHIASRGLCALAKSQQSVNKSHSHENIFICSTFTRDWCTIAFALGFYCSKIGYSGATIFVM